MGYNGPTRLSFIVATTARPTLTRALKSIRSQPLHPQDEVLLVGTINHNLMPPGLNVFPFECQPGGDWGNTERQLGMKYAMGTHLVFVDDDDALLPGAVDAIRRAADARPSRPTMFRMIDKNGLVLWTDPELRKGNVGTPMFVPPNDPYRLGAWNHDYDGDYQFFLDTLNLYHGGAKVLTWDGAIIYGCRTFGNVGNVD